MASFARNLARLYVDAEIARDEALRGGVKESDLPPVEAFRGVLGFPRQEVESKRVERWIHPYTTEPLSDEQSTRVRMTGSDAYLIGSDTPLRLWHKAMFDRVVILKEQRSRRIESFLASLVVPGLMADEVAGWTPPESLSPHVVLAHLAGLEGAPAPDRRDQREREIVYRRVPEAGGMPSDPTTSQASEAA